MPKQPLQRLILIEPFPVGNGHTAAGEGKQKAATYTSASKPLEQSVRGSVEGVSRTRFQRPNWVNRAATASCPPWAVA